MIYIFLADGFEETEAILPRDILKRAGIDIQTVSINKEIVTSTQKLKILTDVQIENINLNDMEGIILPGGMPGTKNLEENKKIIEIINYCINNNLLVAAICASPSILGKNGFLKEKNACCYPEFEKYLKDAKVLKTPVVQDKNIITSMGPGTAMQFGFAIVEYLKGKDISEKIKKDMIYFK